MNQKQLIVYLLTFFAYAGLHSLREGWSLSKTQLKKQFKYEDNIFFGLVDTLYLFSYSLGMMVLGNFSHKIQLKYFVSIGMILASIAYMFVAFSYTISGSFNQVAVTIFMCLNGFFQCTGWPGLMGIFGNWFDKGKLGVLMGIWAINANIGNIIAEILCNLLQTQFNASWVYNFYLTGLFTIIIAVLIIFCITDKPKHNQQQSQFQQNKQKYSVLTQQAQPKAFPTLPQQQKQKPKSMSVFSALCFPRVPFYVIGYAMLKGCIYGLLFWLPTYLTDKNLSDQKGYISAMVDTGSFIGGLVIGYIGDKYKYRAMLLSPLLFFSSLVMFFTAYVLSDVAWEYYVMMFLIGISIGGPYNIIGTVITIDLGKQTLERGGSTATISALVQGTAAIFAAVSQILLSYMDQSLIFYIFFAECIIAAIVLFPLCRSEWIQFQKSRKSQKFLTQTTSQN